MRTLAIRLAICLVLVTAWTNVARAEDQPQQGVTMTVYSGVDLGGPWLNLSTTEPCYAGVVSMIDFDWGGGPAAENCPADFFMVHFTGWLTVPESGTYEWLNWSDDGWRMTLDGVIATDDWNFHGCGGHWSGPNEGYFELVAGQSYALDVWMFEWGGGACARLWYGGPMGYGPVPAAWLTTSALPTPEPSPSEPPSPEPSVEPSPTETPESPSPSVSVAPSPLPEPSQEPSPTPEPTPEATPTPTATPTPEPSSLPVESTSPSSTPSPSPSPSEEPSQTPVPPSPTPEPPSDAAEAVAAVVGEAVAAVGESIAAVAESIGEAAQFVADLGKDITPAERKEASKVILPAIIIGQVTQTIAAAAAAASAATTSTLRARSNK